MGLLVLITGTGRSGTSTMSGTLHHLGLHVPGPYLGANESNPKGFFESKWAVGFHKKITAAARINDFDGRPLAFERAQQAITPELRRELVDFLTTQAAEGDQVVVKDPRSVWAQALWRDAAAEAGLDIRYISMLRHPAEVVGSRTTYYASPDDEEKRRNYEIFNVGRWVNSSVVSERETRGLPRAFVRYTDLLEDWRPVAVRLRDELGLRYDGAALGEGSPVDEFIDPGLRRHQVTWEELRVPGELQDLAEQIWKDLELLAAAGGEDAAASADLDEAGAHYARLFLEASAISHDAMEEARAEARLAGAKAAARKRGKGRGAGNGGRPAGPVPPGRRPVDEVAARDLARELVRRARARVTRRA
ncbi:sulfotransferase family protein [Nocardioides panaciterrulae]|uniref:Sulfotransferase family protein n=1 Tax=Nocardioides panaciterrulae TaxID=661492 RepID=A0A7Y9E985_9ACTN|nr:hypothetical protein [Nocardioides panaciterrulae]NYD43543.1 hypothetical protein [Nocardioides panaciterrulae]